MANSSSSNGQFLTKLPVFDDKNYDCWIIQMKVIFRYQDVLEVVCGSVTMIGGTTTEAQRATNHDQKKKDCKDHFLIHQCVDAEVFKKIL